MVMLNLGCGDTVLDEYDNLDLRTDVPGVKAVDVRRLPYPDDSVDEIIALDILEHFWRDDIQALLYEWKRVLKPRSYMFIRVPNLAVLMGRLNGPEHENVVENIYGGHRFGPDGAWDTHHWGWTPLSFEVEMTKADLSIVSNDNQPNMLVIVRK